MGSIDFETSQYYNPIIRVNVHVSKQWICHRLAYCGLTSIALIKPLEFPHPWCAKWLAASLRLQRALSSSQSVLGVLASLDLDEYQGNLECAMAAIGLSAGRSLRDFGEEHPANSIASDATGHPKMEGWGEMFCFSRRIVPIHGSNMKRSIWWVGNCCVDDYNITSTSLQHLGTS